MNFHSCEKQIFKYFGWTKIRKDLYGTKTSPNEVMQITATRQLEKLIFDCLPVVAGSWKSRFKIFQFKCLLNQLGYCPKQSYDRFPSVGDHIHVTTTFEYARTTPGHVIIGGP